MKHEVKTLIKCKISRGISFSSSVKFNIASKERHIIQCFLTHECINIRRTEIKMNYNIPINEATEKVWMKNCYFPDNGEFLGTDQQLSFVHFHRTSLACYDKDILRSTHNKTSLRLIYTYTNSRWMN